MIYATGDTHCPIDIRKLNTKNFPQQREMTKQDYVIIVGDAGIYWNNLIDASEKYWIKWLNNKNFTTLFIDGNHENHAKLKSGFLAQEILNIKPSFMDYTVDDGYKIVSKFGGYVGKLSDSIYHLRRGEIYVIDGVKFFVMGGAESIDRADRIEGKNWWSEEIPNHREFYYGLDNLDKYDRRVDYVLGHTAPNYIVGKYLYNNDCGKCDPVTKYFDRVVEIVQFKKMFFGHFHKDILFDNKFHCLYNEIVRVV
jgi:hypothetical protein